jgi:hypothetical protein
METFNVLIDVFVQIIIISICLVKSKALFSIAVISTANTIEVGNTYLDGGC